MLNCYHSEDIISRLQKLLRTSFPSSELFRVARFCLGIILSSNFPKRMFILQEFLRFLEERLKVICETLGFRILGNFLTDIVFKSTRK